MREIAGISENTNGNITSKAGIGTYTYNSPKPHAVDGITNVDPGYDPPPHDLTFTPFNKVADIEGYNDALGHTYRQAFTYGPERSRKLVRTYEDGQHIKSRVYAGGVYEEVTDHQSGTTEKHHYIYGGDGLAAILVTQGSTENLYYVHKDYLGSILCLSNESGNVVERYSFDSWGHRRNPSDWSQWENGTSYITDRGFTGHQHMDLFGLINMNGRIYDPDLGRFISPDPYVQMPNNSQNFNRYSYALNNPLVYTDPSGEFLDLALFLGGSAIMGGWFWGSDGDNFNWNKAWKGAGATLLMTGTMVASAALPGLIPSHPGALPGLIMTSGQFGLTAINTGAYSWMTTGDFDPNWAAAGISAIPGLISSVAGGIDAVKHGGDFWTGEGAIYAYKLPGGGITRVEAKNYLKNYKNWDWDLELLKDRYKGMFGIEENDFNISLHTKPGDNWGLTSGGKYFHLHDKYIAGGYTKYGKWFSSNIFISPGVVKTNAIEFQAVAGHELIHAVHGNMMVGHPFEKATESMAYQYSYNVYLSNGYFNKAMNIRSYAIRKGWWNIWKPKYDIHIPSPLGISIP